MPITQDNHYVPRLYLNYFADGEGVVHRYRTLVATDTAQEWKPFKAAGVAYQKHLYTRALVDGDSDEVERWLAKDFEHPAKETLEKIAASTQLTKHDYHLLTRFAVAQTVRTPAFFFSNIQRWKEEAAKLNEQSLKNLASALEASRATGIPLSASPRLDEAERYPMRVTTEPSANPDKVVLKLQTMAGRPTWIFAMRHLLTQTIEKLTLHKWSIIEAQDNLPWFTTDDPVIALRFRNFADYSFDASGGWGLPHMNLLLPLSPRHLLYTQVGDKRPPNGTVFPRDLSFFIRKIIAEHAHRYIFSPFPDESITHLRPRSTDLDAVRRESELWKRWHSEQSHAERSLLAPSAVPGAPSSRQLHRR